MVKVKSISVCVSIERIAFRASDGLLWHIKKIDSEGFKMDNVFNKFLDVT